MTLKLYGIRPFVCYILYTVILYAVFSLMYCAQYHILYTVPCNTVLYTVYNKIYCIKHKYSRLSFRTGFLEENGEGGNCCHNVDLRERWL